MSTKRKPTPQAESAIEQCAIYARKSNSKGLDQRFNSIDAQISFCKEHRIDNTPNRKLVRIYSDGGKSGATLDRKDFQKMLADAQAGVFKTLILYKIDRVSRSLLGFAKLEEMVKSTGAKIECAREDYDDTTTSGRLMRNMRMSISEYERELGIERTTDKIASTRKQGLWTGGHTPIGYDVKSMRLIVNRLEIKTPRDIFALYLEHRSALAVARILRTKGYLTKARKFRGSERNARTWTKSMVLRVLRNAIYAGYVEHDGQLYKGEHEAIIPLETFEQVQTLLDAQTTQGESHEINPDYLLRGLLRCATKTNDGTPCGHALVPGSTRKGSTEYRYYRCSGREKMGRDVCSCRSLPAQGLEDYVADQIASVSDDPTFMARLRDYAKQTIALRPALTAERATLASRADDLTSQGETLVESMRNASQDVRTIFERKINAIAESLRAAELRLKLLDETIACMSNVETKAKELVSQLARFREVWPMLNSENRARLVHAFVDVIQVNESGAQLEIVFSPLARELPSFFDSEQIAQNDGTARIEPLRLAVRGGLFRKKSSAVSFDDSAPVLTLPIRQPAKVARMLALAHHIERAIDEGRYESQTDVASTLKMTKARITQVMALTYLAPDLQEQILFLTSVDGSEPLYERALRPVLRADTWARQRELWARLIAPDLQIASETGVRAVNRGPSLSDQKARVRESIAPHGKRGKRTRDPKNKGPGST